MTAPFRGRNVRVNKVRSVDPRNKRTLTALHHECYRRSELDADLFDSGEWWIATYRGEPIAFAGVRQSRQWSDTVYLCRAGVLPAYRGRGLQKRLIKKRLDYARKHGYAWAITDTRRNPASANSLISAGFRMFEPSRPWSFKDACYWKKQLA